ncbi:MAG: YwbE family protein [Candidatus Thorarchaeota archaeon]|nr:YwbE family protein [Candidatus Thorarchaeota archaeon]
MSTGSSGSAGTHRKNIRPGVVVDVVLKMDQRTGKLTRGVVKEILTNSEIHPRGIKVRLRDGRVGRVQAIIGRPVEEDRQSSN